jgi:threonine dehydratase
MCPSWDMGEKVSIANGPPPFPRFRTGQIRNAGLVRSSARRTLLAMEPMATLSELEAISVEIDAQVPATPQISWPLLNARARCELWVKHENHTSIGSFKIRGALNYLNRLVEREPQVRGVIAATRGNFGQAVAHAAERHGLPATIVVPHGNSVEKNRAMSGLGAELIEHGMDFQAALEHSERLASQRDLHWVPPFHRDLVLGNAASMLAFLRAIPVADSLYVSIGMGSGICAMIAVRDALGLPTRIIGVASSRAPAIALSYEARRVVPHPATTRIADGMACSTPYGEALEIILGGAERVILVADDAAEAAMRAYFSDTHNVAEGAAGAALAAVLGEGPVVAGKRVGVVLTGGNVDAAVFARVLRGADDVQ